MDVNFGQTNDETDSEKANAPSSDIAVTAIPTKPEESAPDTALTRRFGALGPMFGALFRSGVEARGIERVPEDERSPRRVRCICDSECQFAHQNFLRNTWNNLWMVRSPFKMSLSTNFLCEQWFSVNCVLSEHSARHKPASLLLTHLQLPSL